jgi:UDP-N-acetylglucosamine 2-epimerase (non-hydrolysing)
VSRVLVAVGTRPEAIKLAPVVGELRRLDDIEVVVLATGQHREQLDTALRVFGIEPDDDLDVMTERQALADLMGLMTPAAARAIERWSPAWVVVQGDTMTAFAVALAAFLVGVPVAHVEAGLRSGVLRTPFPEEASRRMTDVLSELDLPPTPLGRAHLLAEGKPADRIVVTGQTAVDAIRAASSWTPLPEQLAGRELVTVTMHRRENWPILDRMAAALGEVARRHPELTFVYPMHRNPVVREQVEPVLSVIPNFVLDEPYDYGPMAALMAASRLIVTDSGGLLEEGASLGRHVAVLRNVTERPEAIDLGLATLVGNDPDRIVATVDRLLAAPGSLPGSPDRSPYGDGRASVRGAQAIAWQLGMADRPEEWVPEQPG